MYNAISTQNIYVPPQSVYELMNGSEEQLELVDSAIKRAKCGSQEIIIHNLVMIADGLVREQNLTHIVRCRSVWMNDLNMTNMELLLLCER